ncbi:hypothetical protein K439DRAFT_1354758 [Ramaria rubella]|nr:hypothetical protein K439DRAFT_1354758 [Ramaria rubella]
MRTYLIAHVWGAFLISCALLSDPTNATSSPALDHDQSFPVPPAESFFSIRNVPDNEVTYVQTHNSDSESWKRLSWSSPGNQPDTTVVLLNWSRLENVILQVSVYCGPLLRGIHFSTTKCDRERVEIFNSPSNVYFQARFIGCVQSHSRFCFLQDDDYITRPEILRNIHASFLLAAFTARSPSAIILLPSHDHLETELLDVSVPYPGPRTGLVYTSFACLGHGTFLLQSQAAAYLSLLHDLKLSEEEMNIADNYFTLLNARSPRIWLTHTIELSDASSTAPFTVGVEGTERNWRHIEHAMVYLNTALLRDAGALSTDDIRPSGPGASRIYTAPCIQDACTISSNITMIPSWCNLPCIWTDDVSMRSLQAKRLAQFGHERASWYIKHPLSNAVDGNVETAFRSIGRKWREHSHRRLKSMTMI